MTLGEKNPGAFHADLIPDPPISTKVPRAPPSIASEVNTLALPTA